MKHFLDNHTNEIFVFKSDGSEDAFIPTGLTPITEEVAQTIIDTRLSKQENEANTRVLSSSEIVYKRNMLLNLSDWTQLPDVSPVIKDAYIPYRQALRDLTAQPGFPHEITWPTLP